MKNEVLALVAVCLAAGLLVAAAWFGGERTAAVSYVVSVGGGLFMATVSTGLAIKAWIDLPPSHLVAWIFGHLAVSAIAFTLEEAGWAAWRAAMLSDPEALPMLLTHFEFSLSPVLKVVQGTAFLGLVAVAALVHYKVNPARWSLIVRRVWYVSFMLSAALLFSV